MLLDPDNLTLEEKLAQLIFIRIGSNLPPIVTVSADEDRVHAVLQQCPIGGLVLFNAAWPEVAGTLERLQQASKHPLVVAADLERGAGQQVQRLTVFPHAMAFSKLGSDSATAVEHAAQITAQEACQAGIQMVFAPVADANTNPENPIIATRAYGSVPGEVSKLVSAAVLGIEKSGALAVAKHFPGHGDTTEDSHAEIPVVRSTAEQLRESELAPFRGAVDAGVSLIMTAHVSYPGLDPTGTPATFSQPIIEGVLRQELGFQGAVCTDSLLMEGAKTSFDSEGEMAKAALAAGVDILLDIADPSAVVEYLANEVTSGKLAVERVEAAVQRVAALKNRLASSTAAPRPAVSDESLTNNQGFAQRVAQQAIEIRASASAELKPLLSANDAVTLVLIKPFSLPTDLPEQPLATSLRKAIPDLHYFEFDQTLSASQGAACIAQAKQSEKVVLAIIAKPAAWHAYGMPDSQQELAQQLAQHPEIIIASLGVPTVLEQFPDHIKKFCTYSDVPASQAALAELLCTGRT